MTVTLEGIIYNSAGLPVPNCTVVFELVSAGRLQPVLVLDVADKALITVTRVTAVSGVDGTVALSLWPNDRGNVATRYRVSADAAEFPPFHGYLTSSPSTQDFTTFVANGVPLTTVELSVLTLHIDSPVHLPLPITPDRFVKTDAEGKIIYAAVAPGAGGMTAAVYDSNEDGKVNAADEADAAPWSGITGKPLTFPPETHTHNYAPALGSDDNYVTDAEKAALHSHTNKSTLDKITESGGLPLWNAGAWPGGSGEGSGTSGSVWHSGTGVPAESLGVVTDWYLNDVDGAVYEKTGAVEWTLRDNLTGPTGADGIGTVESVGTLIGTTATAKNAPVDADTLALSDSADSQKLKKLSWDYIKSVLATYFDTVYLKLTGGTVTGDVTIARLRGSTGASTLTVMGSGTGHTQLTLQSPSANSGYNKLTFFNGINEMYFTRAASNNSICIAYDINTPFVNFYGSTGRVGIGMGYSAPAGSVDIKGAGLTTGIGLQVQDSGANVNLKVLDNGQILAARLPVYADNTAAASLATGTLYQTTTGELRIKV